MKKRKRKYDRYAWIDNEIRIRRDKQAPSLGFIDRSIEIGKDK